MACCGKKPKVPKISEEKKKVINKVRKLNYGAIKQGRSKVTMYSRQCFNCNTLVSNVTVCPICGHLL